MLIRRKTKDKIFFSLFVLVAISLAFADLTVYIFSFSNIRAASSITLSGKYNSSENSVSLDWAAAGDEANNYGYRIIRSLGENAEYPDTRGGDQVEPVSKDKISFVWADMPRGLVYYFRVCQLVDSLTCVYSNSVKVDTGAGTMSASFSNPEKDTVVSGMVGVELRASFPATKAYLYIAPSGSTTLGFYRDDSYNLIDSYYYFNFNLDTLAYKDGQYKLTALAYKTDSERTTTTLDIIIDNINETKDTGDYLLPATNMDISYIDPPSRISESTILFTRSGAGAEVYFSVFKDNNFVTGPSPGKDTGSGVFSYSFDISGLDDGQYAIKASANKTGYNEGAAMTDIFVSRVVDAITPAFIEPAADDVIIDSVEADQIDVVTLSFLINSGSVVSGEKLIQVLLNQPVSQVKFVIIGSRSQEYIGKKEDDNNYSFIWPTNEYGDGQYKLIARAFIDNEVIAQEFIDLEINNTAMPPEEAGAETAEEAGAEVLLPICREKGILSTKECRDYILLPGECRSIGLKNLSSCEHYLSLDEECRQRGVSEDECEKYLSIPKICREANIMDRQACEEFLFNEAILAPCTSQGITRQKECSELLLSSDLPLVCQSANINNTSKCWDYYKAKENNYENITVCGDLGLGEAEECQRYLQIWQTDPSCSILGLRGRIACDQHLFKKNNLSICQEAGINEAEECRGYIFNKFITNIQCANEDAWYCANQVYREYLGMLATRQSEYQEIRELMKNNQAGNLSVTQLKNTLIIGRNAIPVIDTETYIKLLPAKESMAINASGLVQTGPALIAMDSDQDSLPNGVERYIGTDPNNRDSDADGLDDWAEIASQSNPSGQGMFSNKGLPLPIRAFLGDNIWGHPLVQGQFDDDYKIQSIKNIISSSQNINSGLGYEISGVAQPNSSVTLYVYSAIPIVGVAATDSGGNFVFELPLILKDGEHNVFAVLNDQTGTVIKKSKPYNLFIKDTQAVSIKSYLNGLASEEEQELNHMMNVYLVFAGVIIVVAMAVLSLLYIMMKYK